MKKKMNPEHRIDTVENTMAEIKVHYDQNPLNWRMLRGRDKDGHYDTYIMNKKALWHLKTEFKTPYEPKGIGVKVMDNPPDIVAAIMEKGEAFPFGEIYHKLEMPPIFAMGMGKYSQNASGQIKSLISSKNEELERNMNKSLGKLLHKEGICQEYY
jgi:hypothetical protein